MRRPAWCSSCGKAFQAKSRKQRDCPKCSTGPEPEESSGELPIVHPIEDEPLVNTLAPGDALSAPPSVVIDGPGEEQRRACPRCAEKILPQAKVCRFCGHDFEFASLEVVSPEPAPLGARLRARTPREDDPHDDRPRRPPPGWEYAVQPKAGSFWWWALLAVALLSIGVLLAQDYAKRERIRLYDEALREEQRAARQREQEEADRATLLLREAMQKKIQRIRDGERDEEPSGR